MSTTPEHTAAAIARIEGRCPKGSIVQQRRSKTRYTVTYVNGKGVGLRGTRGGNYLASLTLFEQWLNTGVYRVVVLDPGPPKDLKAKT